MKKYTLLNLIKGLYLVPALIMCGCGHQNQDADATSSDSVQVENVTKKSENIKHKIIPIGADFTNIICVSGANIIFTPGDYNMEVTGDSSLLNYMETDIESHILTISFASERDKEISLYESKLNVTINISAPDLQCVSLCGSGDFTSKGLWKGEKIMLGVLGSGQFHCDSIECNNFEYQATGTGNAEFVHVKAERMHFANSSTSNVKADVDAGFLLCDNVGHSTMTFTGKAENKEFNPTKNGKILLK